MTAASASPPGGGGFTTGMRTLHWATASLLVGSYVSAWAISSATSSAGASWLTLLHRSCGLAVLTLTAVRLVWRRRTRIPKLPPDTPALQQRAARTTVIGLYGCWCCSLCWD